MTQQGVLIIDVLALLFVMGVVHLMRSGWLYASYGALWIGTAIMVAVLVSVPPLLDRVTRALGAVFPVSALTLLAFVMIVLILVLFSVKLTELHERQTTLIQALALQAIDERERVEVEGERGSR